MTPYPTENGKLYRSDRGIIYTNFDGNFDGNFTAIGSDAKNTKRILPFGIIQLKFLADDNILADDSLAGQCESDGGLDPTKLVIDSKSIRLRIFRPVSLFRICFNYIIKNQENMQFDLSRLPTKCEGKLKPLIELKKLRGEFRKMSEPERIPVKKLAIQQARERKELFSSNNQIILHLSYRYELRNVGPIIYKHIKSDMTNRYRRDLTKLDSRHSREMDLSMGLIMSPERKKILYQINKLTRSMLAYE